MTDQKTILIEANEAISHGDFDGFLSYCTDDISWTMVGEETLHGKNAVREWMKKTYKKPPKFSVDKLLVDGDYVIASGDITIEDEKGGSTHSEYCDVWRFDNGLMTELKAFAIDTH